MYEDNPVSPREIEAKPDRLYRAITVDPRKIDLSFFHQPLKPGESAKEAAMKDGNELGVYMSTNPNMSEAAYTHTPISGMEIETPPYNLYGMNRFIRLPNFAIVYEVYSHNLPIRKPKIAGPMNGVYNNGFEGDEWITDEVPPQNYKVNKFIVSDADNHFNRSIIPVEDNTEISLERSFIDALKEFESRTQRILEFADFIKLLPERDRMSEFRLKRLWEEHVRQIEKQRELEI